MKIKFEMGNIDGVAAEFANIGKKISKVADAMIKAGAKECVTAWQAGIDAHGYVKSGDMRKSVKAGKIREANGGRMADIYPQGTDARGVSNAMKAFILHYGKSNQPGSHWVDQVNEAAEEPVNAAMKQVYDSQIGG